MSAPTSQSETAENLQTVWVVVMSSFSHGEASAFAYATRELAEASIAATVAATWSDHFDLSEDPLPTVVDEHAIDRWSDASTWWMQVNECQVNTDLRQV